ncbi:MAG: NusG domain II-containing protein [Halanaerobiaceae bacterium]
MKKILTHMTLYDRLLIIIIIVISVVIFIFPVNKIIDGNQAGNREIVIQDQDGVVERIPVAETYEGESLIIKVTGPIGTSIIEIRQGRVRMKEAPPEDPHKICEKTGWISEPGPRIICVPNKITIWIETEETDLDGITG